MAKPAPASPPLTHPLPARRNSDWCALRQWMFDIVTPVEPPLRKEWTIEVPGKIENLSAAGGHLLIAWGRTGWDIVDAATGNVKVSVAAGPKREEYVTEAQLLPGGEFVWIRRSQDRTFLWNPLTNNKEPFTDCYFAGFLGDVLLIRNRQHLLAKVVNGKSQGFPKCDLEYVPHTYCRDPFWIRTLHGDNSRDYQVIDPDTESVVWSRLITSSHIEGTFSAWAGGFVYDEQDSSRRVLEVVDIATGKTLWKRYIKMPKSKQWAKCSIGALYAPHFVHLAWGVDGVGWRTIVDVAADKVLWEFENDKKEGMIRGVSGAVAWMRERPLCGVESSYSSDVDLVARRLETGEEIWRGRGLSDVIIHGGRVYAWRGRKLTCWGPGEPDASPAAPDGSSAKAGKGAAKKGRGKVAEPADEATWRDLMYFSNGKTVQHALRLGALLDLLRKKFPGVKQLPGGVIEVYDDADAFWGRLSVSKKLGRGRSYTEDTDILGLDVVADESVLDCVNTALRKAKLDWDALD